MREKLGQGEHTETENKLKTYWTYDIYSFNCIYNEKNRFGEHKRLLSKALKIQLRLIGNTASIYISAKLKKINKKSYMYKSLQFPVEMNTRGSKNDNFYSFSHKVGFTVTEFWLIKPNFHTITCRILCYDFKTILTSCAISKLIFLNVVVTYSV